MEAPPIIAVASKQKGREIALRALLIPGIVFGILLILVFLAKPRPPKESKLLQNFYANRQAFEQLRDMLQADGHLQRVASWGVETTKPFFLGYPSPANFPKDRFEQYLALLKQSGCVVASRNDGDPADPSVVMWADGWAGDTRHIGICWLQTAPTNQISTLDGSHNQDVNERPVVFRHVDQNWYLWADF